MYPTQSNPSAPVQPSSPYNPAVKIEPPPYAAVVGQDSNNAKFPNPPAGGYPAYGAPTQGPYPPPAGGHAPYSGDLGLGYGAPSQAPYPPGPPNQGPYPPGPIPMPMGGPTNMQTQVGFTGPVTMEPRPMGGYQPGGYGQMPGPNYNNYNPGNQDGMIYPQQQQQYNTNQYQQQQQPGTVYVVHKNEEQSSMANDCCLWACCAAACCCLCECLKACISDD